MSKRKVPKFIELKPHTILNNIAGTTVKFSCRLKFIDKIRMLFSKSVWFDMHSNDIHALSELAWVVDEDVDLEKIK